MNRAILTHYGFTGSHNAKMAHVIFQALVKSTVLCDLHFFCLTVSHRPLTNYYQYSLGVLALCVSGIRVNNHVSHKLIKASENELFKHGETESIGELKPLQSCWVGDLQLVKFSDL